MTTKKVIKDKSGIVVLELLCALLLFTGIGVVTLMLFLDASQLRTRIAEKDILLEESYSIKREIEPMIIESKGGVELEGTQLTIGNEVYNLDDLQIKGRRYSVNISGEKESSTLILRIGDKGEIVQTYNVGDSF